MKMARRAWSRGASARASARGRRSHPERHDGKAAAAAAAIWATGLRKSYGTTVALAGLDLQVERGEIVGLIGPDGAGKTSCMRLLAGLLRADGGECTVLDLDCRTEAHRLKQHLGYMPQRFSLYPDLSVAENLRFFADLFGVARAARRAREAELLAFARLEEFRSRRAGQLSGGMKQKLALACTLIHTPDVLILDEPTTGVDPVSRQEFWRILRRLADDGLALLVSTPYMDEADLCHRVILIDRGTALLAGRPSEIPAHYPRLLVALRGPDLQAARTALVGWEGRSVHRFGDRLHVGVEDDAQLVRLRAHLGPLQVSVERVVPSTEDVFVEMTTRARGGDAAHPAGAPR